MHTQIKSLSPSSFYQIKSACAFPFVVNNYFKENNIDWYLLLPNFSKNAHLGTVIHKLWEESVKGLIQDEEEFEKKWELYVAQEEAIIKSNYPSIKDISFCDYDVMFKHCSSILKEKNVHNHRRDTKFDFFCNLELDVSYPGYLTGRIDRVKQLLDGVEIIDYKSGEVYNDNGLIKDSILYQLNLYAICYEYQFNTIVKKLTIVRTADNTEIDIPIMRNEFDLLLEEIKAYIQRINKSISSNTIESLQILDEERCSFCRCKHLCNKYLCSEYRSENIVDGILEDISNKNNWKMRNNNTYFSVTQMAELEIENLDTLVGKHLLFFNVSNRNNNVYKRTNRTLIFQTND